jgi:pyridoxamine 5'-phosphate oxidase family protein
MSVFTPAELEFLRGHTLGRLATADATGQPHSIPLTYVYNAAEDCIDLGGIDFAGGKKWRDMQANPKVAFLVDVAGADGASAVEVRGTAELHDTGGSAINPRFPNFVEEFARIRPAHIVSWGLVADPAAPMGTEWSSRRVG